MRDKLAWVVDGAREVVEDGIGLGGLAATQVEADVAVGTLPGPVDADALLDLVLGSYLAHAVRRSVPDDAWRERTVALLERVLTPPGSARARSRRR